MDYGITLNRIKDDILNDYYGGMPSDDAEYSDDQIMFKIFRWRDVLIRRDVEKRGIESVFMQTIYPEFEVVNTIKCDTGLDCMILRSTETIPRRIRLKTGFAYSVSSLDDMRSISVIEPHEAKWIIHSDFTALDPRVTIRDDNYMYLFIDELIRNLRVSGMWYDPREAARFTNCDTNDPCYTDDDPFPMTGDLSTVIYQEIMKELREPQKVTIDDENDSSE